MSDAAKQENCQMQQSGKTVSCIRREDCQLHHGGSTIRCRRVERLSDAANQYKAVSGQHRQLSLSEVIQTHM